MNKSAFVTLIIFLFSLLNAVYAAVIKNKNETLILTGSHIISASASAPNSSINWCVNRIEIDEVNGSIFETDSIYTATGSSTAFWLEKLDGKYTFYKIFAEDMGIVDSLEVQVFSPSKIQKYLYKSSHSYFKPILVYILVPSTLRSQTNMVIVMHGAQRNADQYIEPWKSFAIKYNYIAAAPEFNNTDWPGSRSYNLGNMFTGKDGAGSLIPKENWSFSIVKDIQRTLCKGFGLSDSLYDIWGHSAGAQFVHRMMLFCPDNNVRYAIPANAGWYTAPDLTIPYPHGVKHQFLRLTSSDLIDYTNRSLVIMRGTADTVRDSNLNTDPLSDAQGLNRYQRANYFYSKGKALNAELKWRLIDVKGVNHRYSGMAVAAQLFLLNNPTLVEKKNDNNMVENFHLSQNYPNPFNPSTTIVYEIPSTEKVKLEIYNILGKRMAMLVNDIQQPGQYRVVWNGMNGFGQQVTSGIYFYKLQSGNFINVKKMIMLK